MAKRKKLPLSPAEFTLIYRVLITIQGLDSITAQRSVNALLDDLEEMGDPIPLTPDESRIGAAQAYQIADDVTWELSRSDEDTLKQQLQAGVKRFTSGYARPIPGLLDRLEGLKAEGAEPDIPAAADA